MAVLTIRTVTAMGDNVIIAVCNMLLPLTMLGLGLMIRLTKPGYGDAFGYRTTWSLKSKETWERAQGLFGGLCTKVYAVISFVSLICGIIPIVGGFDKDVSGIIACILNLVQFISVFVIIGVTDGIVKREFDKDGNRKGGELE